MIDPEPAAGAAEAGHHLVGDEQHTVTPADIGDGRPVVVGRDGGGQRGADDGLGHERGDRPGARLAIVRSSSAASSSAEPRALAPGSPERYG